MVACPGSVAAEDRSRAASPGCRTALEQEPGPACLENCIPGKNKERSVPRVPRTFGPRTFAPLLAAAAMVVSYVVPSFADFDVTDEPPLPSFSRPRFQVDAGTMVSGATPEVAVAFRISYAELRFLDDEMGNRAEFDLVILVSKGSRRIGGDLWEVTIPADPNPDHDLRDTYYRRVVRIPAEEGDVLVEVSVHERHSGRSSRMEWELEVPDYRDEKLSISTIWTRPCDGVDSAELAFPPPDWVLSHRYGEPLQRLCMTGEIYRQELSGPVELEWRVVDLGDDVVQEGSRSLPEGDRVPFVVEPDLRSLWLGNYLFEVEVQSDGERAKRRFRFQMDESMVSLETNLEQSMELLRLIAAEDEIDRIRNVVPEERARAWDEFWTRRDPTPGTPANEFRTEFFERVRHANENFGVLEPGWKSDRGRVYIRYGPPDEVESRPSTMNGLAVEVWTYMRAGRRFVFVDYDGFGRYELYQPGRS